MEATAMEQFLSLMTTGLTWLMTSVGTVAGVIVQTPLLAFSLTVFAAGAVVGLIGRMLSRG